MKVVEGLIFYVDRHTIVHLSATTCVYFLLKKRDQPKWLLHNINMYTRVCIHMYMHIYTNINTSRHIGTYECTVANRIGSFSGQYVHMCAYVIVYSIIHIMYMWV